jgi:DNA-binding NarL/FixJ family response regulator
LWLQLEAPFEAARSRKLIARACRSLGDEDSATLEVEAARNAFAALGATRELAELEVLSAPTDSGAYGLSSREHEVLCLVATGKSNREIAGSLGLSEHTVARHLQNIFAKLGVSSRTAASAFAYEHDLV